MAAGTNKRFEASHPKCLTKIEGVTLLDRLISQFHQVGVRDIYVVVRTGFPWHGIWWVTVGLRPVSLLMVGGTKYAFDSFRQAMSRLSPDVSTISILGDCVVARPVIRDLVANEKIILAITHPPGKARRDDDYLGMSIPASLLPKFLEICAGAPNMRHQDFFVDHCWDSGLPMAVPTYPEKPWVNVNTREDAKEAQAWLKAQKEKAT